MSTDRPLQRREPNPNRSHPLHCPWCASENLFPDEIEDFGWLCHDCSRVFAVRYYGQNESEGQHSPAKSTAQALKDSLSRHGHDHVAGGGGAGA